MKEQNNFWAANLKFLRNRKKMTQDDLAAALQFTRTKLKALETGATRNPPLEDQVLISDYFKVDIDTFVRLDLSKLGELHLRELEAGDMSYVTGKKMRVLATTITPDNKEQVEMVSHSVQAGYTAGYADPDYISSLPVFHMPQLPADRKFRMFPVKGESMLPVPEGAYVIVEYIQDWSTLKDGTPCVVITKNEGIVFKVIYNRIQPNGLLHLVSLNPLFKPYDLPVSEVLEMWKYHSYWTNTDLSPQSDMDAILQALGKLDAKVEQLVSSAHTAG